MKAIVLTTKNELPTLIDRPKPSPEAGEVLVEIRAAALNHRDVWISKGQYPGIEEGITLGSDGAGLVGDRRVLINPNVHWGDNPAFPDKSYTILGMPTNGTFAEYLSVSEDRLIDMPEHLDFNQGAALPLGGLTAYRALVTKGQVKAGDTVLISGVGGGVALFAFQFALAAGADVYVTSGSEEKIQKAMDMGAKGGANYKDPAFAKSLKGMARGFDVVIDSAGGDGLAQLAKLCNPGARIAMYGGTRGKINGLSPQILFWKQISFLGTSMGTDQEFEDMVAFVAKHKIVPVVDSVFDFTEAQQAFERMDNGLQFGKIVLKV
ncbi:MAG: NAD(P)-dependent alcohol dehydrogenase [Bacteroidota bacterium]